MVDDVVVVVLASLLRVVVVWVVADVLDLVLVPFLAVDVLVVLDVGVVASAAFSLVVNVCLLTDFVRVPMSTVSEDVDVACIVLVAGGVEASVVLDLVFLGVVVSVVVVVVGVVFVVKGFVVCLGLVV